MPGDHKVEKPNLRGDRLNILILLSMYVLQNLPRTMMNAIQLILQNRHATYKEQALISLASTAFTFKIVWEPIVDCTYSKRLGRRKSWVIPAQYLMSALLLLQSIKVDDWLGSEDGTKRPHILYLTVTFLLAAWLASLQDIAIDAWGLTMLQRRNIGYQATCNMTGLAVGQMLGYIAFTVLCFKDFCNYFRSNPRDYAFVELSEFMLFWAVVFIFMNTLILIFKRDNSLDCVDNNEECRQGVIETYKRLWRILTIGPVQKLCFLLITSMVFFGPVNAVVRLKLMDEGVPRDKFVLISLPSVPALLILPFVLNRYLTKKWALRACLTCFTFRIIFDAVYAVFVYFTGYFKIGNTSNSFSGVYYVLLLFVFNLDNIAHYGMWMTSTAFCTHIADTRFGGMYATLFSAMSNVGIKWGETIFIWLKDVLTFTSCPNVDDVKECTMIVDGFCVEIVLCMLLGFVWLYWARRLVDQLEGMDVSAFKLPDTRVVVTEDGSMFTGSDHKKHAFQNAEE